MPEGADTRGSWRSLAPAYAAIALLLFPALVGIRAMLAPRPSAVPREAIRVVGAPRMLGPEAERGNASAQKIPIPAYKELSLLVTIPERSGGPTRRDAEILDRRGEPVWRQEGIASLDRQGTYLIVVDRAALRSGSYTLRVTDVEALSGALQGTATFSFDLVGSG